MSDESKKLAEEVLRQKERLLSGQEGGYTPIPHYICRELLPELKTKYDGQTARDCVLLYNYLHAYVNGQSEGDVYMWAYPSVKQIRDDTGIHGDRIKGLVDILVSEEVLVARKIPWKGHTKKMYLPKYFR